MLNRRTLLKAGLGLTAMAALPFRASAAASVEEGMKSSKLIYLSPLKSNGELSRCQAEIWFVEQDGDMYVCTDTVSWRAQAPQKGLSRTQVWVGDVGVWTRSRGKYLELPSLEAEASIVDSNAPIIETLLEQFGDKYPVGWIRWGRSFRNGLADGSRTMLKYTPVA